MIFRARALIARPQVLADVGSPAAAERARAVAYYTADPPPGTNMTFNVYKRDQVKEALNRLFAGKCAYCESAYEATQPMEVEHFRPKGEVFTASGIMLPTGYWFRASTWENLLPSCTDCNRGRWHKVGKQRYFYGKHSKFPLASPDHAVDETGIANEIPLLIDPSSEDPSTHLGFVIAPKKEVAAFAPVNAAGVEDPKGRTSIDIYGLNRPGLVKARTSRLSCFEFALRSIERGRLDAEKHKGDLTRYNEALARLRLELREVITLYLHWKNPYAAMCRSAFHVWKERLEKQLAQAAAGQPVPSVAEPA